MLVVGLTGGIGSGKSTATRYFESLGIPVIDADVIARQLVEPGQPALDSITSNFGTGILTQAGRLDRSQLRDIIFKDTHARQKLEHIMHPLIEAEIRRRLGTLDAPYCIVAIPLLIEAGQTILVDRILVVDIDEEIQLHRIRQREPNLNDTTIEAIIQAQATRKQRLTHANDIVNNNGDKSDLEKQLFLLHQQYVQLSQQPHV